MQNDLFSKSEIPSMCLRDVKRTEAFRAAINRVVKPGDVVLDAGAGSGILSFFAAAAGARKVYSVEYDSGLAELLRRNAARNGFAEIIEVIAGDVRELRLPVQVDVLIAELIETWLLDELQIPALNALRANRVIGAKTKMIPERYEAFAMFGHVDFDCYGFQLPFPLHNWPYLPESTGWQMLPFHPLTEAVKAFELRFNRYSDPNFQMTIRANSIAAGKVNAMRLSGVAHLTNDLTLGATVAFNGDKVIPIEAFDVQFGQPVSLSLSGNRGGIEQACGSTGYGRANAKPNLHRGHHKLSWISLKAETRDTGKYGYGVFAIESFAKDERIALLGGHILTLKELMTLGGKSQEMAYQIGDDLFSAYATEEELRVWRSGLAGDYFNHSCVPNAGFRGMIEVVVMREIEAGEQITFDYAMCSTQSFDDMDCLCGAANCRKRFTGDDWKLPELQRRYRGYFQHFIEEKIKRLND